MTGLVVDLYAGPGGWDEGLRDAGITGVVGFEWDKHACATAQAAGHQRVRADVARLATARIVAKMWGLVGSPPCTKFSTAGNGMGRRFLALLADGIRAMFCGEDRRQQIRDDVYPACLDEQLAKNEGRPRSKRWTRERMEQAARDEAYSIVLVLEPARFAADAFAAGGPLTWVLLEQVPEVLPLWQVYKRCLIDAGFSAWAGVLNSADYGVPQTRERAVLMARRGRPVHPPAATHAKEPKGADLFGGELLPWMSMAEALGWGMTARPSMTVTGGGAATGGAEPFGNAARQGMVREADEGRWLLHTNRGQLPDGTRQVVDPAAGPAPTLTGKSGGQWQFVGDARENATGRDLDEPAPTVFSSRPGNLRWALRNGTNACTRDADEPAGTLFFGQRLNNVSWVVRTSFGTPAESGGTHELDPHQRPAHVVTSKTKYWTVSRPATTVAGDPRIAPPGRGDRAGGERQHEQSVRVTVQEAAVLQSFPADYPWRGTKTAQFLQVGNAVPPRMAEAIVRAVTA